MNLLELPGMDDTLSSSIYAEAKGEYMKQLCVFLSNPLLKFFLNLFETAKKEQPKNALAHYQTLLSQIPEWNQDKVSVETSVIQKNCGCDYMEELLTAVFIAHTKVLAAIRLSNKKANLQVTVPKVEHFLHRALQDSARRIWGSVYLFSEGPALEKQKGLRKVEGLINESIQNAVRGLLPVKSLLKDYLMEDVVEPTELSAHESRDLAPVPAPAPAPAALAIPVMQESTPASVPAPVPTVQEPEIVQESTTAITNPTIVVDTEPSVHFSEYNTVFHPSSPDRNDIVPENDNNSEDDDAENGVLQIHDETTGPLNDTDFEDFDNKDANLIQEIPMDDFSLLS